MVEAEKGRCFWEGDLIKGCYVNFRSIFRTDLEISSCVG